VCFWRFCGEIFNQNPTQYKIENNPKQIAYLERRWWFFLPPGRESFGSERRFPMGVLRVSLFGKFHVQLGEQVLTSLDARKVQELFCYLLLYRDRHHPREALASLLWSDSPAAQSKKYLRQALWKLRAATAPQTEPANVCVLLLDPDWVQLNPEAELWLDVAEFEQAFNFVRGMPGWQLDAQRAQALQRAVPLYQGDLLEGWYQDWCLFERERLQNMYLVMLDKLIDYCEAHHEYEDGLAYGTRILRYDRARECTHRRLIRLQYLGGNRTAALRQYEHCVAALDEELGVKPTNRTVTLYEQIRMDRFDGSVPAPIKTDMALEATTATLLEVLDRLKQLQTVLTNAQHRIQQDVQTIELALNGQR
jgi:DNA-binding SARP family transcriptional activator